MTVVVEPVVSSVPEEPPVVPRRWNRAVVSRIAGVVLCSLAVILFGFLAEVTVIGRFEQSHDQTLAYATLRYDLANAIAPVGSRDYQGNQLTLGTPIALINIPEIGLNEVVAEGTTSRVLQSGPGHRRDTVLPGQTGTSVIMGRNATYGGPFHYIDQLQRGDTFTVTTGQGVATYRVLDVRKAGDVEPPAATAKSGRLTLITASGSRFVPSDLLRVDSELLSPVQPSPGGAPVAIGSDEAAQAGDPGAWPQIVLWTQLTVLAAAAAFWARSHWGRLQAWLLGAPVLAVLGLTLADQIARLLPNLL